MALGGNLVLMETVKFFRMTSDEAPLRRGGGMRYASLALPRRRLLLPVLALGLLLFSGYHSAWAQTQPDSARADTGQTWISKRNPWAAFGLSCLLPGGGQFYNHEKSKGCLMLKLFIPAAIGYMYCSIKYPEYDTTNNPSTIDGVIYLSSYLINIGVRTWSMIDAPLSAKRINRRNGNTSLKNPSVGLVFAPDPRNPRRLRPGVGLRAGF
jgi:hypothetical protein